MQRVALIILLASMNAYALGPEEQEFYGVTPNGEKQTLKYISTNEEDSNGRRIYGTGSQEKKEFSCEITDNGLKCADAKSKLPHTLYRHVSENEKLFRDSVKPYKNNGTGPGFAHSVFACTTNCRNNNPKVYVIVSYGD